MPLEFARGTVRFKVGKKGYIADIIVGTKKDGEAIPYDLVNLKKKKIVAETSGAEQSHRIEVSTTISSSIQQSEAKVKEESKKV